MSLKRLFLPQKPRGHNNSTDFPTEINSNPPNDDSNKSHEHVKKNSLVEEQYHRTRRQSNVQILNIKLFHTLSNQLDNTSNDPINIPEDVCECE